MGLFEAAPRWIGGGEGRGGEEWRGKGGGKEAHFHKIFPAYPKMMKLDRVIPYLKKIQKYINHVRHSLISADISIFHRKSANTDIGKYR